MIADFLQRVETAPWPSSLAENHRPRVEHNADGDIVILRLDGMQVQPKDSFDALSRLTRLSDLTLNYTNISDEQLKRVAELHELKSITLNHTAVGDQGLKALAGMEKLSVLCLGGVKATPEGVRALKKAKPKLLSVTLGAMTTMARARPDHESPHVYLRPLTNVPLPKILDASID